VNLSTEILYDTRKTPKETRRLKIVLFLKCAGSVVFLGCWTAASLVILLHQNGSEQYGEKVAVAMGYLLVGVTFFAIFWVGSIQRTLKQLKAGILLTSVSLQICNEDVLLADVLRAELRWFGAMGNMLAVDCRRRKGEKVRIVTLIIPERDTKDVRKLAESIRSLKGWPEQEEVPASTLSDWRRERKRLLD